MLDHTLQGKKGGKKSHLPLIPYCHSSDYSYNFNTFFSYAAKQAQNPKAENECLISAWFYGKLY